MTTPKLDPRPARDDLTSRECAKVIGALVCGLAGMATFEAVSAALAYWASPGGLEKLQAVFRPDGPIEEAASPAESR